MKVALYARVSTFDKGQEPLTQLRPLRDYCEKAGWEYDEFIDYCSGIDERRPQFNELLVQLKRREYDALVVWKLDRLARSLRQLINIVYGELRSRNIQFISLTETIDTTTPSGELLFHILGAMAQFEHDLISERVKAGMARAKGQGRSIGRPRASVNIQSLLEAYQYCKTVAGAARELGLNPGTAWGYLKEAGAFEREGK